MYTFIIILDVLIICAAAGSAWLWWAASRRRVRRIRRDEVLDAADLNRIVTTINRSQMLNSRAALATGCAAFLAVLRLWLDAAAMG